jgi:hypothetical protein
MREAEVLLPPGSKFKIISRTVPEADANGVLRGPTRVVVEAILPKKAPLRQASGGLQTIAADMREGFVNTVAKGNQVELLNPQTGTWRAIDPESISQKVVG